jgi:hypothetical protein
MGQQQLILLVLATVIVGIAIIIGIQAFSENQAKANADAMVHDGVRMASDAQLWKKKPSAFGGQPLNGNTPYGSGTFTGLTSLGQLGYNTETVVGDPAASTNATAYKNMNAVYALAGPGDANGLKIVGKNCIEGNGIVITVTGTASSEIKSEVKSVEKATTIDGCAFPS